MLNPLMAELNSLQGVCNKAEHFYNISLLTVLLGCTIGVSQFHTRGITSLLTLNTTF